MTGLFVRSPGSRHKGVLHSKASEAAMQMVMRPLQQNYWFASTVRKRKPPTRSDTCRQGHAISSATPINRRRIDDLAKALLERQTLTGKEVKKVLAASLQAQMQEARTLSLEALRIPSHLSQPKELTGALDRTARKTSGR